MVLDRIYAGWLIDGSGCPARKNIFLHEHNGCIQSIKPFREDGNRFAPYSDFSEFTLLPGLIDSHVHLCLPETPDSPDQGELSAFSPIERVGAVAARIRRYVSHGIAAVRDGGDRFEKILQVKQSGGIPAGPKVTVFTPGAALFRKGRYGGFIGKPVGDGETLADVVESLASRVDHIKILNSGINSLKHYGRETPSQFSLSELRQAVSMAARYDRYVMVHANGREPVAGAVEAGCRSIEHGYFMGKDNLMKMRDHQVIWVPTVIPMKAYSDLLPPGSAEAEVARRTLDDQLKQISLARELGVRVAAGSDAGSPGVGHGEGLIEELKLLIIAGYSIEEAISCATVNAAGLLGSYVSGKVEVGEKCILLAVPGSPDRLPGSLAETRWIIPPL